MIIAACTIELWLPETGSLKAKRHIVKSVIERIKSKINASVAEVGMQDVWQRTVIGVAMVSNDKSVLEKQIEVIRRILDNCAEAEQTSFTIEFY